MFKVKWTLATEFVDQVTGVVVIVNKTNHLIPKYSAEVGRYKDLPNGQQEFIPFVGAQVVQTDLLSGEMDTSHFDALTRMLADAREYIRSELKFYAQEVRRAKEDSNSGLAVKTKVHGKNRRQPVMTDSPDSDDFSECAAA